ncbi:hypothetical protein AVEN_17454-1 [Araneus ventricosus]|uniref:Uncharacterized protein n=1 Tax=Araneus ventricosus TaxID=182803 RepID=A0A4Y2WT14_ARAVE|nr:hypothetical protein AVEN_17454-1 [Araneus ventricosus]
MGTDEGEYKSSSAARWSCKCSASEYNTAPKIERCPNEVIPSQNTTMERSRSFLFGTGPFDVQLYKDWPEVKEDKHLKFDVFG